MRATLIGAGQIARQHLDCLASLPSVEIAAICDLSAATAEAMAERYGIAMWFTDHKAMLAAVRPDVVHITTPPTAHYALALDAFEAGAHVIVEKPATSSWAELRALAQAAQTADRCLIEDYNYQFNQAPQKILDLVANGAFGAVVHVDVLICLDILGPNGFADPNARHPALALPGGAIGDFLPHLASLAHMFVGAHRHASSVWTKRTASPLPYDEFHAVIEAERGTATLGFSATAQPDAFWLRVYGEKMQAITNLFETRLTFDGPHNVPKPLRPFFSSLDEAKAIRRAAIGTLLRKFKGPGAYEGLWELLGRTYKALAEGTRLPVALDDVIEVNRLIEALRPVEQRS